MALPENFCFFRKRAGLSQKKLAETVGVCQQTIAKYESGERWPSPHGMYRIVKALDITFEELMERNGNTDDEQ